MEITMKVRDFNSVARELLTNWSEMRGRIHAPGKTVYGVISLKKRFEETYETMAQTMVSIVESNGGHLEQDGSFAFDDEHRPEIDRLMQEFHNSDITISATPVVLRAEDELPAELIEIFFDFIQYQE